MNFTLRFLTAVMVSVVCILFPIRDSLAATDIPLIKKPQVDKVNTNWLTDHPRIRLGDDFVWPPFVFLDEKEIYSGISSGYVNLISQKTGLEFSPVLGLTWSQVIEGIKTGEIDMLPAIVRSKEREKFLNFTKPYISYPVVIATHSDGGIVADLSDLSERKTGVVKGYITHELLEKDFPAIDLVPFDSLAAGLNALESREIEALVDNLGAITYETRRLRLSHIKIVAPTKYKFELSMAVRKDWPELIAILDKTLDGISTKEKSAIENTWLAVEVNFGINFKTILLWLIPLGTSALIVIMVIVVWNRKLQKEITYNKKNKEKLRNREENIRLLLESTVEGIYGIDVDGICTFANYSCVKILGYDKVDQLLGKNMHDLIHHTREDGSHYPVDECKIFKAFRDREPTHIDDEVFWRADGTSFPAEYRSHPIVQDNKARGTVVTFIDVSERKHTEEVLKNYAMDLEFKTLALEDAKERAEAASSSKGLFLANMSHELRTPLNGIMGMGELLGDSELSSEQQELLNMLNSSSKHLTSIVNDILDFSKVEAGKLEIEKIDFSLKEILNDVFMPMTFKAKKKGLAFSHSVANEIPDSLNGDPMRIKQILFNLLGNAVKFTEKGEIRFDVKMVLMKKEPFLLFSLKDTGIGMNEEETSRVFKVFSQADETTTRQFGGTGLGTAIAKHLVELMGGEISLRSKKGEGSTFSFTLPLRKGELAQEALPENKGTKEDITESVNNISKALVVEDNRINQKLLQALLKNVAVDVAVANHGKEAVQIFQDEEFDIIFMDIQMPIMDGFEATSIIREIEKKSGKHVPIIALTANAMKGDREKCLKAGMDEYLSKPVNRQKLYKIIEVFNEAR